MPIIRVALDVPLDTLFDYRAENASPRDVGRRVIVPFGKKQMAGVIVQVTAYSELSADRLRSAIRIDRDTAPLPEDLLDLFRFCSRYYHYPLGEVVMSSLPGKLRGTRSAHVRNVAFGYALTEAGRDADWRVIPTRNVIKHRLLAQLKRGGALGPTEIRAISPRAMKAMAELNALGWVAKVSAPSVAPCHAVTVSGSPQLNREQQHVLDGITGKLSSFKTWLLYGITGSGKTEIYLQLIETVTKRGRQALVLVPEINLTPHLERLFKARFPATPLVSLHSGLNASQRFDHWHKAQSGSARIVLGTRLAIFTPLPELGLIIVDEEQDSSFKQQEGLRYSARDVAIFRAKQAHVPVVLGSATPSLESYYNAINDRYGLLRLTTRAVESASLPAIRLIDSRACKPNEGLSEPLIAALKTRLEQKEQSLVFINRRGYAPVLMCPACSWLSSCNRCSGRLVLHLRERRLACHHCGHLAPIPVCCPQCGNQQLKPVGHGTQRIESALAALFPGARIARIDRDTTRRRNAWRDVLDDVREQRLDILVGTQILAKGHDFPNLSLVGIVNPDSSLYSSDFRASEHLFAQLIQVAGRAGRASVAGEVLIQTDFPAHPLYQALCQHDFNTLAHALLAERKQAGFPPFVYQALLRAEAVRLDLALEFLGKAAKAGSSFGEVAIFQPVPASMARLKGMERAQLLVQSSSRAKLQSFLSRWYGRLDGLAGHRVRWQLDVDPLEV